MPEAQDRIKENPGVDRYKNKWRVRIYRGGKQVVLGYYDSEEAAVKAYNDYYAEHPKLTSEQRKLKQTYDAIRKQVLNTNPDTNHRGVRKRPNGKYEARIGFQGERIYIGLYDKLEDAIKARKAKEKELFGEFLREYKGNMDARDL